MEHIMIWAVNKGNRWEYQSLDSVGTCWVLCDKKLTVVYTYHTTGCCDCLMCIHIILQTDMIVWCVYVSYYRLMWLFDVYTYHTTCCCDCLMCICITLHADVIVWCVYVSYYRLMWLFDVYTYHTTGWCDCLMCIHIILQSDLIV